MTVYRPYLALLCALLLLRRPAASPPTSPPAHPTRQATPPAAPVADAPHGILGKITNPYRRRRRCRRPTWPIRPRSNRCCAPATSISRLQDAIALALENNLDIAIQRYGPQIGGRRGAAGAGRRFRARRFHQRHRPDPSSASVTSSGTTAGTNQSAASQASTATSSAVGASVIQSSGPGIPSLDPIAHRHLELGHPTTPQSSAFITGTNSWSSAQDIGNFGIQKGFLTGTTVSLGLNNTLGHQQQPAQRFQPGHQLFARPDASPSTCCRVSARRVNSRQIRIAKNNREVSDLTFKLQVETTVAAVMELYWDLVAFNENVQRGAGGAGAPPQRLLEDNKQAGGSGHAGAHRSDARRGADRRRRAGSCGGADQRAAAGDHPQDGAQPDRRGQPLDRRRAHHPHRPHPAFRTWSRSRRSRT